MRVEDRHGEPIEHVDLELMRLDAGDLETEPIRAFVRERSEGLVLLRVPPRAHVSLSALAHPLAVEEERLRTLAADAVLRVDLVLEPAAPAWLDVRLEGPPLERVELRSPLTGTEVATLDVGSWPDPIPAPAGTFHLRAWFDPPRDAPYREELVLSEPVRLHAGRTTAIELTPARGGWLRLEIATAASAAQGPGQASRSARARCRVVDESGGSETVSFLVSGIPSNRLPIVPPGTHRSSHGLAPGSYRVDLLARGWTHPPLSVEIVEGEVTEARVTLVPE